MKSLLFILLAGYAVRSDENNYYVVEMLDDLPIKTKTPFKVYWNVPTMQCSSKKVHFDNLYEKFGIIQNDNDRFKGEKVTILYDPGLFPALFKNETSGKFLFRNGGVPQEGNLDEHLDALKNDLDLSVPDRDFSGIGIIDFESWRPVFRQNFGELRPYKDVSYEIEKKLHWWWQKARIEAEAKRRFQVAAKVFMKTTLTVAKQLRPNARWGFYGFPYCFNMASNNMLEGCAANVPQENDQIPWLWSESTALYPSVYSSVKLSTSQLTSLIRGRVREAKRCAATRTDTDILPYFWFRYRDSGYLSETDLNMALATLYQSNATGFIVWGSSNDVNTLAKCKKLLNYVENVFGPAIAKYTKPTNKLEDENDIRYTTHSSNNITTENPIFNDVLNFNTKINTDRESYWHPQENFTQDINKTIKDNTQDTSAENSENTIVLKNSLLIDLILDAVLNNVDNTNTTTDTSSKDEKKDVLNYVDLIIYSTESNDHTSTETSQITSTDVTNNLSLNGINTNSRVGIKIINNITSSESTKLDLMTTYDNSKTYKQTKVQAADSSASYTNLEQEIKTTESVSEITTTDSDMYLRKEDDYDETFDGDDDDFFNLNIFGGEFTTISTPEATDANFVSKQSKSDRKIRLKKPTSYDRIDTETTTNYIVAATVSEMEISLENYKDSTTDKSNENFRNSVEGKKLMIESSSTITTTHVFTTDPVMYRREEPYIKITLNENNLKNKPTKIITLKNETIARSTKKYLPDFDNTILHLTETNFTNSPQSETSMDNNHILEATSDVTINTTLESKIPNDTKNPEDRINVSCKELEESKTTQEVEDTSTSIVPTFTTTEQVVVN